MSRARRGVPVATLFFAARLRRDRGLAFRANGAVARAVHVWAGVNRHGDNSCQARSGEGTRCRHRCDGFLMFARPTGGSLGATASSMRAWPCSSSDGAWPGLAVLRRQAPDSLAARGLRPFAAAEIEQGISIHEAPWRHVAHASCSPSAPREDGESAISRACRVRIAARSRGDGRGARG